MSKGIQEILKSTVGHDSLYVLEKSGVAIYEGDVNDIRYAKGLLNSYGDNIKELLNLINQHPGYNPEWTNYEFEILNFAIAKLLLLLGGTTDKDKELEAAVYHKFIRNQDSLIRKILEEIEE